MIYVYTLGEASIEIDPPAHAHDGIDPTSEDRRRARNRIVPSAPRRFAVLLYLTMERGRRVGREQLQSLVFPEQSETRGRHSLREVLYKLRAMGCEIIGDDDDLMIPREAVWCDATDALEQEELGEATMRAMAGGFLSRCVPTPSEAYGEWLESLRAITLPALSRRAVAASASAAHLARWELAELAARACLALDSLNEEANCILAEVLASGGAKVAAVQLLETYAAEAGTRSSDLRVPVATLRRRIGEGLLTGYSSDDDARPGRARPIIFPPFIGRDSEMAALHEALERARGGDAQCVVVGGDPGIGKTRLVDEFSRTAALKGARVERVVMQPHDGERPMGAFVDAVPGLLRAPGALGCAPASMTALRNLTRQASDDATPAGPIDAEQHERRWSALSRAITDLCEAIATEAPLVLVVDDAQWLDALSANTLGRVVARRRKAAILVILTSRDSRKVVREVRLTERCRTLALGPLDTKSAATLLHALIPDDGASSVGRRRSPGSRGGDGGTSVALKERISSHSAGNPLFLISLATTSRGSNGSLNIPHTIIESFTQRIDALSRRGQSVLATCVALGKHSSVSRLVAALELKSHELLESLLELTDSGLVLQNELNAVPAHPMVSEALGIRLPESVRRLVAGSVAAALEREAESGASPGLWWDVAESWRAADNAQRAINALRRCADHALEIGRPGEAARILGHAAGLVESRDSAIDVNRAMMRAADSANEFNLVIAAAIRLSELQFEPPHDELELAEFRATVSFFHSSAAAEQRLLKCIRAKEATATHRIEAASHLLKCADMFGRPDLLNVALTAMTESELDAVDPLTRLDFRLLARSALGDRQGAAALARQMLTLCAGEESNVLRRQRNAATAFVLSNCTTDAIAVLKELFSSSVRRGSLRSQLFAAVQLCAVHFDVADDSEADYWLAKAREIQQESPDLRSDFELAAIRTEIALCRRQPEQLPMILCDPELEAPTLGGGWFRWGRATEVAIRVCEGSVDADVLDRVRLIVSDKLRSMSGVREFEIAVCIDALASAGLRTEAMVALKHYLNSERAVDRPPTRFLRLVTSKVGIDIERLDDAKGRPNPASFPHSSSSSDPIEAGFTV